MAIDITIVVAVVTILWGVVVLWSNPGRRVNVLAFSMSQHVALWIVFRYVASVSDDALFWIRMTIALGAFIPAHLRIFLDTIASPAEGLGRLIARSRRWVAGSGLLAAIVFTEWFIPESSTRVRPQVGPAYIIHFAGLVLLYLTLIYRARRIARERSGIEKLELNLILVGGACAAMTVLLLMVSKRVWSVDVHPQFQIVVVFIFFVGLCVAVTTRKIFDARHIFTVGLRSAIVFGAVCLIAYCVDRFIREFTDTNFAFFVTVGVVLISHRPLDRLFSRLLKLSPKVAEVRRAAFDVARRGARSTDLDIEFSQVLRAWSQSEKVEIYSASADNNTLSLGLPPDIDSISGIIKSLRWVTPERLTREKTDSDRMRALTFLKERRLGVMIFCGSAVSQLVLCIGERPSRRPFTYPEVQLLFEIGAIMEASYSRCILAARAHDAERLATVGVLGASVAHEIRNPLVTIKAFVQLLPVHHESHDFRQKFSRLIGQEVFRIERLTEQLLDLAAPRKYVMEPHNLHAILSESLELLSTRAQEKNVKIETEFDAKLDTVITDVNAVRQILLNLCFNAIQAQEGQDKERWVKISTVERPLGVELAVSDNGPGIAAEVRNRLFQTFQTTKSSGFGLGLAICGEIARSINAGISVDTQCDGTGAIFRVLFPCQRRLSW